LRLFVDDERKTSSWDALSPFLVDAAPPLPGHGLSFLDEDYCALAQFGLHLLLDPEGGPACLPACLPARLLWQKSAPLVRLRFPFSSVG